MLWHRKQCLQPYNQRFEFMWSGLHRLLRSAWSCRTRLSRRKTKEPTSHVVRVYIGTANRLCHAVNMERLTAWIHSSTRGQAGEATLTLCHVHLYPTENQLFVASGILVPYPYHMTHSHTFLRLFLRGSSPLESACAATNSRTPRHIKRR